MKISVLMDNTPSRDGFLFEHGLSLYLETEGRRILFDMGQSKGFQRNAEMLHINLAGVELAVLSHGHYDHGGGLETFLQINPQAPVYVSRYAFEPCYSGAERYIGLQPSLAANPRLHRTGEMQILSDALSLHACNDQPRPYRMEGEGLFALRDGQLIPDDFRHEQYLLIREGGRRIVISGCSHKGVENIVEWLKPDVLVGGFHWMKIDPQGPRRAALEAAADRLLAKPVQYYTCHCTGLAQYAALKPRMGNRLTYLAAGAQVEI